MSRAIRPCRPQAWWPGGLFAVVLALTSGLHAGTGPPVPPTSPLDAGTAPGAVVSAVSQAMASELPAIFPPVYRFPGPTKALGEVFRRLDADSDGKLSPDERRRVVTEPNRAPRDLNADGFVSRAEFEISFRRVYDWTPSDRSLLAFRFVIEGRRLLVDGYPDKALSVARSAVQSYPEWSDNWVQLGDIYSRQGNQDKAVEAYRKALELSPNFEGAWFSIARFAPAAALAVGEPDPLRRALRLLTLRFEVFGLDLKSPTDTVNEERLMFSVMNRFLLELRQPEQALVLARWCRENMGLRPRLEALGLLALAQTGQPEKALAEVRTRVETENDDFYYLEAQARILLYLQRPLEALECLRQALSLPGQPIDRRRMKLDQFMLLSNLGQHQEAERLLEALLPQLDTPSLKVVAGRALARTGKLPKAIELCREAISASTCMPSEWMQLARLHALAGDRDGHIRTLREAIEKCPGPPQFLERARSMLERAVAGEALPTDGPGPAGPAGPGSGGPGFSGAAPGPAGPGFGGPARPMPRTSGTEGAGLHGPPGTGSSGAANPASR